jgi:hypothetical protein
MALVTISLTGDLQFALATGQGRVSTDALWLPITLADYDTKAVQTPPQIMPPVDTTGSGLEKLARKTGTTTLDGYYHQFQATFDAGSGGAPDRLTAALRAYFGYGGAVTVYGLDPYYDDGTAPDGRKFQYWYWDGLMKRPNLTARVTAWCAYVLTLEFYRMTRRARP